MKEMTANDDSRTVPDRRSEVRGLPRDARGPIAPRPRLCQFAGVSAGSTGFLRALDIGCGTGAIAVRLARLGLHVTLLDGPYQCWISRSVPRGKPELRRGLR